MDRLRTLLLARSHLVVMDPDLVASATTRPSRDADLDRLEDELAQLGFVMSLELAMTMRRLPQQTTQELRSWLRDTLAARLGPQRPHVPLHPTLTEDPRADADARYLRRMLTWLATADQPCPWCCAHDVAGALDPCGHLVCRTCWQSTGYAACPVCHRRVAVGEPFAQPRARTAQVAHHAGTLSVVHLAFDLDGATRARVQRLLERTTPLPPDDRAELEAMFDEIGAAAADWLPAQIPVRDNMAMAAARLLLVAADRSAMMRTLATHLHGATDVLRVAVSLMGGDTTCLHDRRLEAPPVRLRSLGRGLRRALLEALERLPLEQLCEDIGRHAELWKRIGERLHPFEDADRFPHVALAFAIVRRTPISQLDFGTALREQAVRLPFVYVEDDLVKPIRWAGPIEDALRAGNPRSALVRLTHRPSELLARADHLVRVAQLRQPDALATILKAIEIAGRRGAAGPMLALAAHASRRTRPWPRRVFVSGGRVLRAWGTRDARPPLRGDAIAMIVGSLRRNLVARAETLRQFPRAVIDRGLIDLLVPIRERLRQPGAPAWPRGSELALPRGQTLRLFLHWQDPPGHAVDLDLAVVMFDERWRHVATCDSAHPIVGERRAAVHGGDLTSAPAPLGATELVDLHLEQLYTLGVRHLVMALWNEREVPLARLARGFAGLVVAPELDPREATLRFDVGGRSRLTVPLAIDLAERKLRWTNVTIAERSALREVGGYRAALAHVGRDLADLIATHARPTLWDVACIHAAARANTIYVRERDGSFTVYRRRDRESSVERLNRLLSGSDDDGKGAGLPSTEAPTWFAVITAMALPRGSVGYALDSRGLPDDGIERVGAADLVAKLAPRDLR
jgi:hypothetical protein